VRASGHGCFWGASTAPKLGKVGSKLLVVPFIASPQITSNNAKRLEIDLFCNSFTFNDFVGVSAS
jgi:hypothetical protein